MMFDNSLKQDKGVAGLTILLSLVTMLFVIGLLVFIFAIMGSELKASDSLAQEDSATVTQASVVFTDAGTTLTTCNAKPEGVITAISSAYNSTVLLASSNYTFSGCVLTAVGTSNYNGTTITNVTYTMTYGGTAYEVVNDTSDSIVGVTDWYDIFIVIGAMVVLILLTVIIITAIRGSGLMAGETKGRSGNVGTA